VLGLGDIGRGLDEAFFMFWQTLWALVLGYLISGAVQAFVSRAEMRRALGDHRLAAVARGTVFGAISSSCSYAAAAVARTLVAGGADFTTAIVFMVASTNLVVELGLVLWLLIGWQFALAELVGGVIMVALLALVLPRYVGAAGVRPVDGGHDHGDQGGPDDDVPWSLRLRSRQRWGAAAAATRADLLMVRRELLLGFLIAGMLSALVPVHAWQTLFVTGHGLGASVENVVVAPVLACISFVCSIGNVPLAAALWRGGISFGGVVAFVYADLLALPLILIYRRYFGTAVTVRLVAVLWAVMSAGGLATEYLFRWLGLVPESRPHAVVHTGFALDHTLVLDAVALAVLAVLFLNGRRSPAYAADAHAHCH
jgi:uncharacterized membrane protein YraQ (UPF0718 family)